MGYVPVMEVKDQSKNQYSLQWYNLWRELGVLLPTQSPVQRCDSSREQHPEFNVIARAQLKCSEVAGQINYKHPIEVCVHTRFE